MGSPRSRWAATSAWLLRDRCLGDVQTTVLAHCRRYARAILVTANTALAIAIAPSALAQDAPGPPWWYGLPLPDEPTGTLLIQNVQRTPASAFDPQLPPIPFDAWLWVTLAPLVEFLPERVRRDQQLAEWRVRYCPDITSAIPHASSPELCVNGTVVLSAEKQVKIVIAVADGVRGVTTGSLRWRRKQPSLREVYIERLTGRIDSLDVPTLGALPQLLDTPFEQWPTVDFESTITWDPPNPAPGETVRFSISVRNTGQRSVDRAWIDILIGRCCDSAGEVRHEWFPRIAAGQSVRVDVAVPLPDGMALTMVSVRPFEGHKRIRQSNGDKPPTVVPLGYPPCPR